MSKAKEIGEFLEAMDFASLDPAGRTFVRLCVRAMFYGDREALDVVTRHALRHAKEWAEDFEDYQYLRDGNRQLRAEADLPEVYDA